jgi:hypothetical protein
MKITRKDSKQAVKFDCPVILANHPPDAKEIQLIFFSKCEFFSQMIRMIVFLIIRKVL